MGVDDWNRVNKETPRIVDVLPNGPVGHPTSVLYASGGVPEVMLHLQGHGSARYVGPHSDRPDPGRQPGLVGGAPSAAEQVRTYVREVTGVDPDNVILEPDRARARGLTSTVCFPAGQSSPPRARSSKARRSILLW